MKPKIGDSIEMSVMDDGLDRKVLVVNEVQPYSNLGIYSVSDQFAESHLVEYDGTTWETVNPFAVIEPW